MYEPSQLYTEIDGVIRERIAAGNIIRKEWICHEVLSQHPMPEHPDSDFTECCRRLAVTEAVNRVNKRFKEDAASVAQGELPLAGYAYLQKAYPVERDGESLLVPIHRLTSAEIRAKVALYREMASGCLGHADELDRYGAQQDAAD